MTKRLFTALVAALVVPTLFILGTLVWVYAPSIQLLLQKWEEPDYSHGFLVPAFSLFLLWTRRDMVPAHPWSGTWVGAGLIVLSALFYLAAGILGFRLIIAFSLVPCLAGIVLMLGGWPMMRWAWPALLFLCFMIPLPQSIETMARLPLQRLAAIASTYLLQTLGLPAVAYGNTIHLSERPIDVAEACSGLRMLMTSVALTTGLAFVMNRPLWERWVVVASAIPIALVVNVLRITVTGICYEYLSPEFAERVFHDLAGWLMMPTAIGLLWLEMIVLSRLTFEPDKNVVLAGALVGDH